MKYISFLTICRYINAIKKTEKSDEKTRLLVILTSLVNWAVESEEIYSIPINSKDLSDINKYLKECETLVCSKFDDAAKFIKKYLLTGNLTPDGYDSFVKIEAEFYKINEKKLKADVKKLFSKDDIEALSIIISKNIYKECKKADVFAYKSKKKVKIKLYHSAFSLGPHISEIEKIKSAIKDITGYEALITYCFIPLEEETPLGLA